MAMYVASTTKTRLHAYPATVDTSLTMIHLDVYVRVANVIILIILIIARLTRLICNLMSRIVKKTYNNVIRRASTFL